MTSPYSYATFASGCFWGVEQAFRQIPGVLSTQVGYTGGSVPHPGYLDVCGGMTGHVEAVQMTYDSTQVHYDDLLQVFWSIHDPTKRDYESPKGPQYRSVIFYHNPEQEQLAHASREQLRRSQRFDRDILTQIVAASIFYPAEDDHQQYFEKRSRLQ